MKKLNLGCGFKHKENFLNVDFFSECEPDILHNLEEFPYPFESDSVNEVVLDNVLEHLGQNFLVFNQIIKELYRICCNQALINIKVPHPRHDNFFGDPTHVRAILPQTLALYDQERNREWIREKSANSPLGIVHGVDFRIMNVNFILDNNYRKAVEAKQISEEQIRQLASSSNNVVAEIDIQWEVRKKER